MLAENLILLRNMKPKIQVSIIDVRNQSESCLLYTSRCVEETDFTFRTIEFEQMELEFFCEPGTDLEWFQYWRAFCRDWLLSLGIKEDEMRLRDHSAEELCFDSKGTTCLLYTSMK